jgi:hypothetical protein
MEDLFSIVQKEDKEQLLIDLFQAYFDARKNKRNKKAALRFEYNFESEVIAMHQKIINRTYKPSRSIAFIVTKPVIREVFAAHFRDRVVHHYIYNKISPIFEQQFIEDSYSCRKGKGTLYGINRIFEKIERCSENYTKDSYILKLDVRGYFYSMDKTILYNTIQKTLLEKKEELLCDYDTLNYLIKTTIYSDPTSNVHKIKDDKNWKILPQNKSLFYAKKGCGLPIGNLTSQLFSNIYMDRFDHFITDQLNIKHYGRYVDDFIIIHHDKNYLLSLIPKLRKFLKEKLNLTLHPKKIYIQHHKRGVEFLGSYIKPHVKYIAKRTKGNFNNLVYQINQEFNSYKTDRDYLEKIRTQINSYLGIMVHFSTFKLRMKTLAKLQHNFFDTFFVDDDMKKIRLRYGVLSA